MLAIKNNSDTLIILLHEIYGINPFMKTTCDYYSLMDYDVYCPDLLNSGQFFDYNQESIAYQHFTENIGFKSAHQKIKSLIIQAKQKYKYIFLIGFSIGATTAWLCSDEKNLCDGIIGFYGSRIRDYLDIMPKCPALLFFASEEKSFHTKELESSLLPKKNIDLHILKGKHGFYDPFNQNYNKQSCKEAKELADKFLEGIKDKQKQHNKFSKKEIQKIQQLINEHKES